MPPETEKSESVVDDLMPEEAFEKRFAFVDNDTLKKNIAIAFEYVVFLLATASKEEHKKLIRSSLYKDALVYTGTVVEACLRGHILSKREYAMAEEIREARNKIHVSGLKNIDNSYKKEDLNMFFDKARKIISKVEKRLAKLSTT